MSNTTKTHDQAKATPQNPDATSGAPKWAATVNDEPIPMPQRHVKVKVIRAQAAIQGDFILVRDHDSPNDVLLRDEETIDLAKGNVFYTVKVCDAKPREHC